jgi:hypothetical protein
VSEPKEASIAYSNPEEASIAYSNPEEASIAESSKFKVNNEPIDSGSDYNNNMPESEEDDKYSDDEDLTKNKEPQDKTADEV